MQTLQPETTPTRAHVHKIIFDQPTLFDRIPILAALHRLLERPNPKPENTSNFWADMEIHVSSV